MNEIQRLSKARQELAEIETIPEAKEMSKKAEAVRQVAKRARRDMNTQNEWAEISLRAQRAWGKMLNETELNKGRPLNKRLHHVTVLPTLFDLDTTKQESHRVGLIASLPDDVFEAYIAETRAPTELTTAGALRLAKKLQRNNVEVFESKYPPEVYHEDYNIFLNRFDNQSVDLLLTDPPYSTEVDNIYRFAHWVEKALRKVKPTGRAYICIGAYPRELEAYLKLLNNDSEFKLANILVWTYRNTIGPQPKDTYMLNWQAILYLHGKEAPPLNCPKMVEQFAVQDINAPDGRTGIRYDTWQKPDELGERLVRHSTQPEDVVIDCFAGTGTFILAAAKLGRKAKGCDINEDKISIAKQRGCTDGV
jgi:16S rRNA G966 N2-methylase RsmD